MSTIDFINIVIVVTVINVVVTVSPFVLCIHRSREMTLINSERKLVSVGFSFLLEQCD